MSEGNMVERVARQLYYKLELEGQTLASGDHWAGLQRSQKRPWMEAARAAIEAMREPTPRMKMVNQSVFMNPAKNYTLEGCDWHRMIDAALSGKE